MRRLVTFGLLVLVLAVIWSGGWFALAAWAEGRVSTVLADIARRGVDVECGERDMVGFPFAMKVACSETALSDRGSGSQARLEGLTAGASVFAPMTAEVDLASPARIQSALFTEPAEVQWDETEVDIGMGMSGPKSISFEAENLSAVLPFPDVTDARVATASAGGTLTPTAEGGSDAALAFTGLALSANGTALPPFNGTIAAQLSVPPRALLSGEAGLQAPLSAQDIKVSLTSGEGRIDIEGDLSVDAEGIVDGAITLRIAGTDALAAYIAALPPERRQIGNAVVGGMLAFGRATNLDGKPASELQIEISRGRAQIGPVDFQVPRIPL